MKAKKKRNSAGDFPCAICGTPAHLHQHHIAGREIPNANHPSNIADICPNCHHAIHFGKLIIEGWVVTTDGPILMYHKKGEESFTGNDATPPLFKK
jgi:hypothetical protein